MQDRVDKSSLFNAEVRAEIDAWIAKYPPQHKQSAVMAALRVVQDDNGGYLTRDLMDQVASYLDMAPIAVYEVATFYSMYELKPVGRHKLCVCTNLSCMINGADKVLDHLQQRLQIGLNEVTEDGRFSLKEVECLGACGGAPVVQLGNKYYERLTSEGLDKIIDELD